jgi:4-methylaminobutanoate oxidase (formaldehyde-forming)
VTYTQLLNARGGIEADVTVTRTAEDAFLIVTGTAFGAHDLAWLRKQARRRAAQDPAAGAVHIADVTGASTCFALWGPQARAILSSLTPADLGNDAFRFMTSQQITVADIPVRAARVTFVGELGWELYASSEYGAALWREVWSAARAAGARAGGYRAIESLRLEKGYRVWGSDLTAETTPDEAGLAFALRMDKDGGFCGRDALLQARDAGGPMRRLRAVLLDDPGHVVVGGEPVRVDGDVVGRVTSGGVGYTLGASIAYAYLPVARADVGSSVQIDLFGAWVPGVVAAEPLFDPAGDRVRA